MTEERMYTTQEVAKILNIDYKRIHKDMNKHLVEPTEVVKGTGRGGIRYMFDADAIRSYAAQRGIYNLDFAIVGGEEDEIDEDGAVKLTPENFNRIVHGGDPVNKPEEKKQTRNAYILNFFKENYNMSNKDLALIMEVSEKRVANLMYGHTARSFDNFMALCTAAKTSNVAFRPEIWYKDDPERYKKLRSWVPYSKAKLLQEYADLQERMKEIEKELGEK